MSIGRTLGVLCLFAASQCFAGVLWDQQPLDVSTGYVNQEFGDFPSFSAYQLHDVTVTGTGWNITSITEYFTTGAWPGSFDARLNIFALSGSAPLPTDDPTSGLLYPAVNVESTLSTVTLSGLNINLAPGDYWIGFTPVLDFGSSGQQFELVASTVGNPSAVRNSGGGFGIGSDWTTTAAFGGATDGSITINGDALTSAPEPATYSLIGGGLLLAGLLKRVRRAPAR
jgi:hypothetical protein